MNKTICDSCLNPVDSPYSIKQNGVWYTVHKRCSDKRIPPTNYAREAFWDSYKRRRDRYNRLPNIAITGKLRSGKSAAADYLTEKYGYTQFAFGDELKRYAHELFNVDASAKPRELYQWFGQTMRARDPDIWIRKCFEAIDRYYYVEIPHKLDPADFRAVISDLRQPNEFDRCRAEGYVIIRVNAADEIRIERAKAAGDNFTDEDLRHETETQLDGFAVDYEIANDGTLSDLHRKIDVIIRNISGWDRTPRQ